MDDNSEKRTIAQKTIDLAQRIANIKLFHVFAFLYAAMAWAVTVDAQGGVGYLRGLGLPSWPLSSAFVISGLIIATNPPRRVFLLAQSPMVVYLVLTILSVAPQPSTALTTPLLIGCVIALHYALQFNHIGRLSWRYVFAAAMVLIGVSAWEYHTVTPAWDIEQRLAAELTGASLILGGVLVVIFNSQAGLLVAGAPFLIYACGHLLYVLGTGFQDWTTVGVALMLVGLLISIPFRDAGNTA